jgi:Phycobilisome degradation protein nblA
MKSTAELSFEQEVMLRTFREQIKNLSLQETQDCMLEILRQSLVKENLIREMLRNSL